MIVTENEELRQDILLFSEQTMEKGHFWCKEKDYNDKSYTREGYHGSTSIFCNYKSHYRDRGMVYRQTDVQTMKYMFGHAIQFYMSPIHQKYSHVYTVDDVRVTPDYVNMKFFNYTTPLAENKVTWWSLSNFDLTNHEKSDHYIKQMKQQCMVVGVRSNDFIGWFVNGFYKPMRPELMCWTVEFTEREIESNWLEVLSRKAVNERALKEDRLPDIHYYYDFECRDCEYKQDFCPRWRK